MAAGVECPGEAWQQVSDPPKQGHVDKTTFVSSMTLKQLQRHGYRAWERNPCLYSKQAHYVLSGSTGSADGVQEVVLGFSTRGTRAIRKKRFLLAVGTYIIRRPVFVRYVLVAYALIVGVYRSLTPRLSPISPRLRK